jgi:Beta-lactamase
MTYRASRNTACVALFALVLPAAACADHAPLEDDLDLAQGALVTSDPGAGPWSPVPRDQVRSVCRLDPDLLDAADKALNTPWAIVRYGRLCHSYRTDREGPSAAYSTTKTLGAVTLGALALQTSALPVRGPKTGPLRATDRVDHWLTRFPYNQDARVAHVMAMVATSPDLSEGHRSFTYDTLGTSQINSLSDIANAAIAQTRGALGKDLDAFVQRYVFTPLGMKDSRWGVGANKSFATSWNTTVLDMARLGLLVLRGGVWSGQRLVSAQWIYDMTHPAFEDANTGYGQLTWLNAREGFSFGGIPTTARTDQGPVSPGPCAPVSIYGSHPHGLSDAPTCGYTCSDPTCSVCEQPFDVGVWQAVGFQGQVIQGHPGLDLLIAAHDVTPLATGPTAPGVLWDAVLPAIVAADPVYRGNRQAFCAAYGGNGYAPDLR